MKYRALEEVAGKLERKRIPFSDLMPWRVRRILLVSSLYDSFTFQEDGNLGEMLFSEYQELNLSLRPHDHASVDGRGSGGGTRRHQTRPRHHDAARRRDGRLRVRPSVPRDGAGTPRGPAGLRHARAGGPQGEAGTQGGIDRCFVWLGDARVFLGVIKWAEDLMNAGHDAELAGVKQHPPHRGLGPILLRLPADALRARSCSRRRRSWRRASIACSSSCACARGPRCFWHRATRTRRRSSGRVGEHLLGVISDARFPRAGKPDPSAGLKFARMVKAEDAGTPVLIQSSDGAMRKKAREAGRRVL